MRPTTTCFGTRKMCELQKFALRCAKMLLRKMRADACDETLMQIQKEQVFTEYIIVVINYL
jgi:hypothetical protein